MSICREDGCTAEQVPGKGWEFCPHHTETRKQARRLAANRRTALIKKRKRAAVLLLCVREGCEEPRLRGKARTLCAAHSLEAAERKRSGRRSHKPTVCEHDGCESAKLPGRGQRFCEAHKAEHAQARADNKATSASRTYVPKVRVPRTPTHRVRSAPMRAPADVRNAWRRADSNSIIKRKYPTMASLDAAYGRTA